MLIFLLLICIFAFFSADAVTIRLKSLMCYETTAEITDEMRIELSCHDTYYNPHPFTGHTMKDGESWIINDDFENPDNYDVTLWLYEDDTYGRDDSSKDDLIDFFTIPPEPLGAFTKDLPDRLSSPHTTHYQVSYEVLSDTILLAELTYFLNIQSFKCNDAQESKDEVYILVNGENIWEEQDLKSGQTLVPSQFLYAGRTEVHSHVKMEVWERDSASSDLIGTYEFDITPEMIGNILSHTFSRDSGIVGDAKYTVTFDIVRP